MDFFFLCVIFWLNLGSLIHLVIVIIMFVLHFKYSAQQNIHTANVFT